MRVWITRAAPGAHKTAAALAAAGHDPLVEPLLQIHALPTPGLAAAAARAGALAFTSAAGVGAFVELQPDVRRGLPVFAVGAATAGVARAAGFTAVAATDGGVSDLAVLIAREPPAGLVLHPCALEPAGDLVGDLAARGIEAAAEAVYQTRLRAPSADVLQRLADDPAWLQAVMVHSAKASQALAQVLRPRPAAAARLMLVAISAPAARPLDDVAFSRRAIADRPGETAMIQALES